MLRFLFPLFPEGTKFYKDIVIILCLVGMFYITVVAISQIDLKKIIAYSSVAHMSYVVLGLCLDNSLGSLGSLYLM